MNGDATNSALHKSELYPSLRRVLTFHNIVLAWVRTRNPPEGP
jgi:hypothetical protein